MHRVYGRFIRSLQRLKVPNGDADKVAVALSGGPDSMALVALVAQWHQLSPVPSVSPPNPTPPRPFLPVILFGARRAVLIRLSMLLWSKPLQNPPFALIVDHQLRPESAAEAQEAATHAQVLGLRSKVLTVDWGRSIPKRSHKMRAARNARYALLLDSCRANGAKHLLTAHHADDQVETFLLRAIHASGIDGLAGISANNRTFVPTHDVRILRPLLQAGLHKADLVALCEALGLWYAHDPTNDVPTYQRNRLRQLLSEAMFTERAAELEAIAKGGGNAETIVAGIIDGKPSQIVQDILTLQQLCARVSRAQHTQAAAVLRQAIMRANEAWPLAPVRLARRIAAELPEYEDYTPKRRCIHWPSQLGALSRCIMHLPHIILSARPLGAADRAAVQTAVSTVLQAVSHSEYPPRLSDISKLADRLVEGRLIGGFTGGGCAVTPVVHSKGRYVLIVPQSAHAEVCALLRPPGDFILQEHVGG